MSKETNTLFKLYQPIVYRIDEKLSTKILDSAFDVLLSNTIAYPQLNLGFFHYLHKTKGKMEQTAIFANRKKVYLVTSPFELSIDKKEETENGIPFISIEIGLKNLIKTIVPDSPSILSRAFIKLWEMIVYFDLIPNVDNFVSSHLAEGPGSFIQATIIFRDLLAKMKKIKTSKNDKYYAVTLHSENEHLLIEKEFMNYYNKEKPKRLHILETIGKKKMKGGDINREDDDIIIQKTMSNGDITKLKTINLFGGHQTGGDGFSEDSDLVTADGGFDWKNENLQEQEAYRLIFGQILTALKVQKSGGNFVLKIFETYTENTIKMIELLRLFYNEVYICKPFTSRISNSEKYVVCKKFNKKSFTASIAKKMEEMVQVMNKNTQFNIIQLFSDFKLDKKTFDLYKNINIELSVKQYEGINNIIQFIHLDNHNGNEYIAYLDKQIEASRFWIDTFLDFSNFNKIEKWINDYKHTFNIYKPHTEAVIVKQEQKELARTFNIPSTKLSRTTNVKTIVKSKGRKKQTGGRLDDDNYLSGGDSDIEEIQTVDPTDAIVSKLLSSDVSSTNSNDEYITKLNNEFDSEELNDLKDDEILFADVIDDKIDEIDTLMSRTTKKITKTSNTSNTSKNNTSKSKTSKSKTSKK
jgi:23S rRNA U2552 (ribose-2'-O)-methylase RlmE/FtsJ